MLTFLIDSGILPVLCVAVLIATRFMKDKPKKKGGEEL